VGLHLISPSYSGFSGLYIDSLLRLRTACAARGLDFAWSAIEGVSDITSARNNIARAFLARGHEMLLMVDADIGYPPETVLKMIDKGVPFAAAAPPARTLDLDLYGKACASGKSDPTRFLSRFHVVASDADRNAGRLTPDEDGFLRIESVGGAFMLLRRAVFETMESRHPELQFLTDGASALQTGFFNRAIIEGIHYGEDRIFCKRWRDGGGEIHLLADASLTHTGAYTFAGNYARFASLV
jgi:hypothetical protein